MQKHDHKCLAKYLLRNVKDKIPAPYRAAFVFGNYEPDINYLTYMHSFWKFDKFHGHHYDNVRPTILRLLRKLERHPNHMMLLDYYRLGKCMHYVADIFTFPHNPQFTGTIPEHMEYEEKLHNRLTEIFAEQDALYYLTLPADKENIKEEIFMLHANYISGQEQYGIEHDCRYILTAARMLAAEYLMPVRESMLYENPFAFTPSGSGISVLRPVK